MINYFPLTIEASAAPSITAYQQGEVLARSSFLLYSISGWLLVN